MRTRTRRRAGAAAVPVPVLPWEVVSGHTPSVLMRLAALATFPRDPGHVLAEVAKDAFQAVARSARDAAYAEDNGYPNVGHATTITLHGKLLSHGAGHREVGVKLGRATHGPDHRVATVSPKDRARLRAALRVVSEVIAGPFAKGERLTLNVSTPPATERLGEEVSWSIPAPVARRLVRLFRSSKVRAASRGAA